MSQEFALDRNRGSAVRNQHLTARAMTHLTFHYTFIFVLGTIFGSARIQTRKIWALKTWQSKWYWLQKCHYSVNETSMLAPLRNHKSVLSAWNILQRRLWTDGSARYRCEAHGIIANESASPTSDNVWNKAATIHRSQEVLNMLSSLHVDIIRN
jgi:hypothetical protein